MLCAQQVLHFIFFHREKNHVLKSIDVRKQLTGKSSSVVEEALFLFFNQQEKKKKLSFASRNSEPVQNSITSGKTGREVAPP